MEQAQIIADYLKKYNLNLKIQYNWGVTDENLNSLGEITNENDVNAIKNKPPYDQRLMLVKLLSPMLSQPATNDQYEKLCNWIIKDWGRITTSYDNVDNLKDPKLSIETLQSFNRISSTSKIAAFKHPDKFVIYDTRIAYSLNWIILSQNAGNQFFPMPDGRNSKMNAFDIEVLIRLNHISTYQMKNEKEAYQGKFISQRDENVFIPKKQAYNTLNELVKEVHFMLWPERKNEPYLTEMLLFAIADQEIFQDITNRAGLIIKTAKN